MAPLLTVLLLCLTGTVGQRIRGSHQRNFTVGNFEIYETRPVPSPLPSPPPPLNQPARQIVTNQATRESSPVVVEEIASNNRFMESIGSESLMLLRRLNDKLVSMEGTETQHLRKLETIEYRMTKVEILLQERASMLEKLENHINRKVENLDWEMNKISTLLEVMREEMEKLEKNQVEIKIEVSKLDLNQIITRLSQIPTLPKDALDGTLGTGDQFAKQQIILTTLYNLRRMTDSLQQRLLAIHHNLTDVSNMTRSIAKYQANQLTKEYFYSVMNDYFPDSSHRGLSINAIIPQLDKDTTTEAIPKDCSEVMAKGHTKNGIYKIRPEGSHTPFFVFCDMTTEGGGWTIIQKRQDGSIHFLRDWRDYKHGFGNLVQEHWLGNEKLFLLTNQKVNMLRIDFEDFDEDKVFASYDAFAIGSEAEGYALKMLGQYEGDAGDSLTYHSSMKFSTPDMDNDPWEGGNCAEMHTGAWWYNGCDTSNLNGQYLHGEVGHENENKGIYWYEWHGPGYSLRKTEMKIRPVEFQNDEDTTPDSITT